MGDDLSSVPYSSYYDRNDWLKVDVVELLAPWVDRVAEIYGIKKKPAKYIVTFALAAISIPYAQEIIDAAFAILDDPDAFQRKYGTRLGPPPQFDPGILINPEGLQPAVPRQVNFMDLVDYWASPINKAFGVGIVQCRDVVKIVLTFFLADHYDPLAETIRELVMSPGSELFSGKEKVGFPELALVESE